MTSEEIIERVLRERANAKKKYNLDLKFVYVDRPTYDLMSRDCFNGSPVISESREDGFDMTIYGIIVITVYEKSHFGVSVG